MKLTIKGNEFTITGAVNKDLPLSKSGKSKSIFSTQGNMKTDVQFEGKAVVVGLNVYISAKGE